MLEKSFTLDSLLETHELPYLIINTALVVVAVNRAWEICFGISRDQQIGKPCCLDNEECRHKQAFDKLEPYVGLFPNQFAQQEKSRVRGQPILDEEGTFYIGESISAPVLTKKKPDSVQMIGTSIAFSNFKTKIEQAARTDIPTMLLGETGTGKEVAAAYLHQHSERANAEFVIVDCTILKDELFESEVFGHEKGAFTGATGSKKGLFQLADQGTLFLDEIGELPLSLQPKLLRALETGQYRRVGGTTTLKANVRVICATHRDLAGMVQQGTFREDLFYRLSVFPINIPSLRDRMQDIPELTDHLLEQAGGLNGHHYSLTKPALIKLIQHQWPGNIRELRNCLQLAAGLCVDYSIDEDDINILQTHVQKAEPMPLAAEKSLPVQINACNGMNPIEIMEAEIINNLMQKHQGSRKKMAEEMNISERTLYRKLKRLNLGQHETL